MSVRCFATLLCLFVSFHAPAKAQVKKALAESDAFFRTPKVVDIAIELEKTELDKLRREPRKYAKATIRVGDKIFPNVGIHIKGAAGSYRGIDDKPGLTINMNKFDEKALFFGMDKWHLANSVQDPSYVSELICGEMFRAVGVPASRVSHALVTINGRKRGLYYIKEGYDKYFLRHHFKDADGNFYDGGFLREIDQPLQLVSSRNDLKDRSDLKALAAAAREPNPQMRMEKLAKVLDMDKFVSYLVLESFTWDWDGYPMNRNNYRIYHDKKADKLVFIPSGMDQMFGHPGGPIIPGFQGMVARAVVDSPEGRKRYYARMAEFNREILDVEKSHKRLDEILAVIQPALATVDKGAAGGLPNQVNRLKQAIVQRSKSIEQQLKPILGDRGVRFNPLGEIKGGADLLVDSIRFNGEKADAAASGKFYWRRKGETKFADLPLERIDKERFKVNLPAAVTKSPFEYYVEVVEAGQKPVMAPARGSQSPLFVVPDLTPPTSVPELSATLVKSFRVTIAWKPASDDRKVVEYRIYRGPADRFPLELKTLIGKLPADKLTLTDNAPTTKQTAWYAVQAIDIVGREGEARYLRVDVPDHRLPPNTLQVQALPASKAVLVTWAGELEPTVAAIEIHRSEGKDPATKKIGEVTNLKQSRYLDKDTKLGVEYRYFVRFRSSTGVVGEPGKTVSASPLRFVKRINCGGPEIVGDDGVPWEADNGDGHPAVKYGGTNTWTSGDNPKKDIYQTERWAGVGLGYFFKLDPGRYEVVLHFAETNSDFASKGARQFDIEINEKKVAEKVDIFTEAKGQGRPWLFRQTVTIKDGGLEIVLRANPVGPAIKGIEIRGLPPAN